MPKSKPVRDSAEETPFEEISIGDQVKHPQWGIGTVLFRSGTGDHSKAVVVFPEEGQKKLMLKYAKVKKVGSAPKSEMAKIRHIEAEKAAAFEEPEIEPAALGDEEEALPLPEEEADIFEDDDEEHFADRGNEREEV
jgi:hypothetical protein